MSELNTPVDETNAEPLVEEVDLQETAPEETGSEDLTEQTDPGDDGTTEDNDEEVTEEVAEAKPKKGLEKRFSQLTDARRKAEEEAAYWKAKAQGEPQKETPAQAQPDKPKFTDYNDLEAYTDAVTDWKLEKFVQKQEQATQQKTVKETFFERRDSFAAKTDDFAEMMAALKEPSQHIAEAILYSDVPGEILYELAQDPDEVDRLNSLPPHRALIELGKLEAKFASKPEAKTQAKKASSAPAPVTPIKGSAKSTKSPEEMTDREYIDWRNRTVGYR